MLEKDLITCQQAAVILGRSPSTVSRALKEGRLSYGDASGNCLSVRVLNSASRTPPDVKQMRLKKRNAMTKRPNVLRFARAAITAWGRRLLAPPASKAHLRHGWGTALLAEGAESSSADAVLPND